MANAPKRQPDNTLKEEVSAMGERAKGAAKDVTSNERMESEGNREMAEGKQRQQANRVFGETGGTSGTDTGWRNNWIGGSFADRERAEHAYNSIASRGYDQKDVNLMMSDDTRKKYFTDADTDLGSKAMEGAGTGGAIGSVAGAILGALAAVGTSVLVPGLGLVIAGPLAGALAGAGAGGVTGGLVGALIGAGIPEEHANRYENDVRSGRIVMGVTPCTKEDADYFAKEWKNY